MATKRLRKEIKRLKSDGWIVNLVGHSHGGNIIIDATTDDEGETQPWLNGRVMLFGTPIYRNSWDHRKRLKLRLGTWLVLSLIAWLALILYSTRGFNPLAAFADGTATQDFAIFVGVTLFFATCFLVLSAVGFLGIPEKTMKYRWSPAFLAINTPFDEAYRSLAGLPGSDNPFLSAKKSSAQTETSPFADFVQLLASVKSSLTGKIRNTLKTIAILPAAFVALLLFLVGLAWRPFAEAVTSRSLSDPGLSMALFVTVMLLLLVACFSRRRFGYAMLFPGILIANTVPLIFKTLFGMLLSIFDSVLKKAAWGLLKSFGLGISGAPRKAEDIDVNLEPRGDNLYLELPTKIVEAVKKEQEPHLKNIQDFLYKADIKWTPGELREQLEETDFPMIHTTYYRNPYCIQKTADWIAEPVHEYWDGFHIHDTMRTVGESGGFIQKVQEKSEGANEYKNHIGRLKLRISAPGSIWCKVLSKSEVVLAAYQCGLPINSWDEYKHIVFERKPHKPSRIPHAPPREKTKESG